MRGLCRATCLLVLLIALLPAQDLGSVMGTVINGTSGTGAAGMNVLLWAKGGAQYQATTDDIGDFRIEQVTPGSYRVRFEKEGFVPLQQDQPPVVVTAGAPASIRVEMNPYATLRGRVLDPGGKPVANVEVEIRRSQGGLGSDTATTDDNGSFVFDRLVSGSFILSANPKPQSGDNGIMAVPTYFPSVEERAQAEKILVRAGTDLSGYEIRMRASPVYRISGRVVDVSGQPAPHATLALISTAEGMSAPPGYGQQGVLLLGILKQETETGVTAGEDGRFTFRLVRSGPWRLVANYHNSTEDPVPMGGAALVTVADHDIDDLQMSVAPLFTLTGTVEFIGDPSPDESRIGGLMLTTADVQGSMVALSRPGGTLHIANLMPGAYRIVAVPGPWGTYSPTSVLSGDHEVLGHVVDLTAASPPLRVVYAASTGVVRGTIEKGVCALVVLLPNPFVPPVAARAQPCNGAGPFELRGVPAGRYYALAFDHVDPTAPPDDAFLRSAVVTAPTVDVGQGPAASIQLTITRWPD